MSEHHAHLDLVGTAADGHHASWRVPVHVQHLPDDALTWFQFEFAGETHRMSVAGSCAPYDVLVTRMFDRQSPPRFATFPIAPERAGEPTPHLENSLRPQLVELHERLLARDMRDRRWRLQHAG
jgi:hypothetical protein